MYNVINCKIKASQTKTVTIKSTMENKRIFLINTFADSLFSVFRYLKKLIKERAKKIIEEVVGEIVSRANPKRVVKPVKRDIITQKKIRNTCTQPKLFVFFNIPNKCQNN